MPMSRPLTDGKFRYRHGRQHQADPGSATCLSAPPCKNMRSPEAFAFLDPWRRRPRFGLRKWRHLRIEDHRRPELCDRGSARWRCEQRVQKMDRRSTRPRLRSKRWANSRFLHLHVPAEFGRTTGGIESFNTKSRHQRFHGNPIRAVSAMKTSTPTFGATTTC